MLCSNGSSCTTLQKRRLAGEELIKKDEMNRTCNNQKGIENMHTL